MQIKIITDSQQWDAWLINNSQYNPFPQSWAWGDVLLAEGKKVERLAVVEGEKILAQAQVVYRGVVFGWQYAFCPQGPVFEKSEIRNPKSETYECISDHLKNQSVIFFRIEPEALLSTPHSLLLKKTIDINPSATLILDLKKSEEEILAGMHQKTRYNIHLAEKKDLQIKNGKDLEVFWNLMNQTGSRDKFSLHHKKHYEKVLVSPTVFQLTAYHRLSGTPPQGGGEKAVPIACAVFARFGSTFTYLYGASDYAHRDLMAPYLLQWQGIKRGKSLGCQQYDFFGIAPRLQSGPSAVIPAASGNPDNSNVPWIPNQVGNDNYKYDQKHQYAGVTRFKLGFGGMSRQAAGTWDAVIDAGKYKLYNFLRRLRRLV